MQARLLPPAPASLAQGLLALPAALDIVQPLRPRHRAQLPSQVAQLSEWLTTAREDLPRDYLSRPALLTAYLHYFLPWNLYRQGRLLAGLDLQLAPGARIVDVGAGPLTFALALWLTRPDLRAVPLRYLAIDRAAAALQAGRRLWDQIAGPGGWAVETVSQPAGARALPEADLLVLANVINEVHRPGGGEGDAEDDPATHLLEQWATALAPGGRVLLIEPGTRPAARQLVALRARAVEQGWRVLAPCTHAERCPQPGIGRLPWCHFAFAATDAPPWLDDLSRRARLAKERASLSFLLLAPPAAGPGPVAGLEADMHPGEVAVRVVSGTFALGDDSRGRYGCAAAGLVLLVDHPGAGAGPAPGELLHVAWPERAEKDAKSGATIVRQRAHGSGPSRPARPQRPPRRPGRT
jgi:SAM-dependent methyltransferase